MLSRQQLKTNEYSKFYIAFFWVSQIIAVINSFIIITSCMRYFKCVYFRTKVTENKYFNIKKLVRKEVGPFYIQLVIFSQLSYFLKISNSILLSMCKVELNIVGISCENVYSTTL